MKSEHKNPAESVLLQFHKNINNLDDIKTEISSCLAIEDHLWLSCDEGSAIERLVKTETGYGNHKHYKLTDYLDLPNEKGESDLEALAYQEPYLWFCGSMSLKRDSPKPEDSIEEQLSDLADIALDENRFNLGCIPCIKTNRGYELYKSVNYKGKELRAKLLKGGNKSSMLHNALMKDEHLSMFMQVPCKDNGFDIEGLAIHKDRIFMGLRGPVLNGYAVILEIRCDELNSDLILAQQNEESLLYRKHFIDLKGMGIRELNITKNGDLYLLAGPTMDLDGTISIYKISGGLEDHFSTIVHQPELIFDVARGSDIEHGKEKAEGMAILNSDQVLITYDSPLPYRLEKEAAVLADIYNL